MKKQIRPRGPDFSFPKRGAFSINTYAANSKLPSNPKPSTAQPSTADPPSASTRNNAESLPMQESVPKAKYSSHKEKVAPITWGVASKEETYQTSYGNYYSTHDKINSTPKSRESLHHMSKMTSTLIPHELYQHRRSKQIGDMNPIHSKRVSTEGDCINDKLGELPQAAWKRGRGHVPEPKVKDPMLETKYRYFKPADISTTPCRDGSASRLIKQILDLSPPKSVTGTTPRRCLESLAYTQELKDSHKTVVDTLGKGYSSVERKAGVDAVKGKRQYLEKRESVEDIKNVMAHSYLLKRDSLEVATNDEREVSGTPKSHRLENYHQSLSYRQNRPTQSFHTSPRVAQSPRESMLRSRETDLSGEKTMSSYQRKPSQEETPQERLTINNMALLGSGNRNSFVRDRSLSNSSKGSAAAVEMPRRTSNGRFDDMERDRSLDKNSFVVVSHERKKPIAGGSFGNPKLSSPQKTIPAAGVKTKRHEQTGLW